MNIGLMGGTFDPVHYGHLCPALEVKSAFQLDKIWLMPNHIPPHKQHTIVSAEQRLAMLQLAAKDEDDIEICDIELQRQQPSYTVETLIKLKQIYPNYQFWFIMGNDAFLTLHQWYKWKTLLTLCNLIICSRPDWALTATDDITIELAQLNIKPVQAQNTIKLSQSTGNIYLFNSTPQPFSSTEIRALIAQGKIKDYQDSMPPAIIDYITEKKLY